jgi:hypothetical protein
MQQYPADHGPMARAGADTVRGNAIVGPGPIRGKSASTRRSTSAGSSYAQRRRQRPVSAFAKSSTKDMVLHLDRTADAHMWAVMNQVQVPPVLTPLGNQTKLQANHSHASAPEQPSEIETGVALCNAAWTGATDAVCKLLWEGADVNAVADAGSGSTPLLLATTAGHTEIVELLLGCGASSMPCDRTGRNALMLAAQYGRLKCIQVSERFQTTLPVRIHTAYVWRILQGGLPEMHPALACCRGEDRRGLGGGRTHGLPPRMRGRARGRGRAADGVRLRHQVRPHATVCHSMSLSTMTAAGRSALTGVRAPPHTVRCCMACVAASRATPDTPARSSLMPSRRRKSGDGPLCWRS